jgi:EmrB/QacA subfamily drug resistance transporter
VESPDSVRRPAAHAASLGWTMALTSIAFFMVALDTLVVVTALPQIHRDLGGDVSLLDWAVNSYNLVFAAGMITAAALGDRLGRRRVYVVGLLLFTVASAACALAPNADALIAARVLQGLGAAIVTPLSLTILTETFPAERRGAAMGIWGGIAGLAVAGGPMVGGAVVQGLDWHWIFWLNVPIGLVAAGLSTVRLPESFGTPSRLDLPATALVSLGSVCVVWGLVRAGDAGWSSRATLAGLAAGIVLLAGFVAWEHRAPQPMLPLRLFRIRSFAAANATAFLMNAAIFSATFLASQYFQFAHGYSAWGAGLRFLPLTATPLVIAPVAGMLTDRIGPRPLMVTGLLVAAAGFAWVALIATPEIGYGSLILPLAVGGAGISMALPAVPAAALTSVAPEDLGKSSGVNNTLQRFGGSFGVAAVTAVFAAYGHLGSPASVTAGFRPALAVSAVLAALGAVTALAVARHRAPARDDEVREMIDHLPEIAATVPGAPAAGGIETG